MIHSDCTHVYVVYKLRGHRTESHQIFTRCSSIVSAVNARREHETCVFFWVAVYLRNGVHVVRHAREIAYTNAVTKCRWHQLAVATAAAGVTWCLLCSPAVSADSAWCSCRLCVSMLCVCVCFPSGPSTLVFQSWLLYRPPRASLVWPILTTAGL